MRSGLSDRNTLTFPAAFFRRYSSFSWQAGSLTSAENYGVNLTPCFYFDTFLA
jgi:hypothetical protein